MQRKWSQVIAAILLIVIAVAPVAAQVTLDWPDGQMVLSETGALMSLTEQTTGRECAREQSSGVVQAIIDGETRSIEMLRPTEAGFDAELAGVDTVLHYSAAAGDEWLLLTLQGISGTRPDSVTLRLPVAVNERVGGVLSIGWDDEVSVCLMAGNLQTRCYARGTDDLFLHAITQDTPGPRLEGAAAALVVCPTERFKEIAREVSRACGLPTNEAPDGVPVKDTDLVRGSYWFIGVTPENQQEIIDYCHLAGIGQVMMTSTSWCKDVGHYTFRDSYPNGREDLKAVVQRFHDNGILVGMHCFVSKVSKSDAYVTPTPDRRFWVDMQDALRADIGADATEITVAGDLSQWAGSSEAADKYWEGGVNKHRECIIGDEIIKYDSVGPEGVWNTFYGCERGAWGTIAAAHSAGDEVRHYGVDGCIDGYIIDQETDLMDEVAERIAEIFDYCGFDMVYFDGGEDVDRRRFHYYSTNFQHQAMERFSKRPIIHMGTVLTHRLWHSFARSGTVDTYLNTLHGAIIGGKQIDQWPTVREHIDRSVRRVVSLKSDMMPAELGWFGIWPKQANTDGLQLDEFEYLLCKSLALDAPVSLQTSITSMQTHPLTPGLLEMFKRYEQLRMDRAVAADLTAPLAEMGRDFVLLQDGGEARFAEVHPMQQVGGTSEVRAMVGATDRGSVATIWHYAGREGTVTLDLPADALTLTGFDGEAKEFVADNGRPVIPIGAHRATLLCEGVEPTALQEALARAEVKVRQPLMLWVTAAECDRIEGEMAPGSQVGVTEEGALSGDVLVCTDRPGYAEPKQWFAEYTVDVPTAGVWTIWARVRYPRGVDDSFGLVAEGEDLTLSGDQVLGNAGQNEAQWHWTGRGAGTAALPPGAPIRRHLEQGPFTFRIYAREGGGLEVNPRLDMICISEDPVLVPTDEMAQEWLGQQANQ